MKLIFIITGLNTGGAEMMLLKLLERLNPKYSPHVISLTTLGGDIGPKIQALGVPVEALEMRAGVVPNPLRLLRLVRRLRALKPDVVHTWMYHSNLFGGLAAHLAGVPAIGWAIHHSNLSPQANKRRTLQVVKACAVLSRWIPDLILCCSEVSRQLHVDYGYKDDKMEVIPNGFDLSRFRPDASARDDIRRELGLQTNVPLVGLIGRFDPQKNHVGFLQAAGFLHLKMPEVHYILAGDRVDESNSEMIQAIKQFGISEVTHLLGQRSDVSRLMAALDVLASSSIGEAFPNVLGEAMACGVPCAVTDVGDSAYIVGDTGRVVQSGDMAGLATAMEDLLTLSKSKREALGERARARVAENFEIGQVVKRYEAFYEGLAGLARNKYGDSDPCAD